MPDLPRGTVTFLFTDIHGAAEPWQPAAEAMAEFSAQVLAILRDAVDGAGGSLYKIGGERTQAAFPTAHQALAAAIDAQTRFHALSSPPDEPRGVCTALHTGAVDPLPNGDYRSPVLNRLGRLLEAGHGGQILLSQVTAELNRDTLGPSVRLVDLGEQRLKDLTRAERVYQATTAELPENFPPLHTLNARPNNLRAQPTPLIGRVTEQAMLHDLLADPDVRLVTLTGPGGAGKTRLALQVAADALGAFTDGVFVVDLASITDPAQVPDALAQVLNVAEDPVLPLLASVVEHLRVRQLLLLLDNLEQVREAGPLVATLLAEAPALKLLATSRIRLNVRGEREGPIAPLPVPDLRRLPRLDVLSQYDSVQLFIERAQAVRPAFAVTNDTAPAVAEICARLDGLPLAIELAAARSRLLAPGAMLERLTTRLPLLVDGPRDLPVRHQTLRGTIAWSYDLLSREEQALFRRLAVFAGGADLAAIEAVASPGLDLPALAGVERLVDHSLLRLHDGDQEPRVGMLETIREYGGEQLATLDEEPRVRQAHAGYFAGLAATAFPHLLGEDQAQWFARLAADNDNLVAALTWLVAHDPAQAVMMVADVWWFWYVRGQLHLGRQQLTVALAASPAVETIGRARALHGAATMAYVMGDTAAARDLGEAALALNRRLGNDRGIPTNLNHLANLALDDDLDRAQTLYEACLEASMRLGDANLAAVARLNLGSLATRQGDFDIARQRYDDALATWRQTGDLGSQAVALANLGNIELLASANHGAAIIWFTESLAICRKIGDLSGMVTCLTGFAHILGLRGVPQTAARLQGAAEAARQEIGELDDQVLSGLDKGLAASVRQALGEADFAAAFSAGAALSVAEALAEAEAALRERAG